MRSNLGIIVTFEEVTKCAIIFSIIAYPILSANQIKDVVKHFLPFKRL